MSPEGRQAAKRRIELEMVNMRSAFGRRYAETSAEFSMRGAHQSSAFILSVHRLAGEELLDRGKKAWEIARQVIDGEGWLPSDEAQADVKAILEEAIWPQSNDVVELYNKVCSFMRGSNWPNLDSSRQHALETMLAEAEIDLLGRKARRPRLLDELAAPRYAAAHMHWRKAIDFSSGPDLPNALKEAAATLESLAQVVLGKPGLTLGEAVKEMRAGRRLPTGADKILEGLYAFASDEPGARHGSSLAAHVDPAHWAFARTATEGAARLLLDLDAR